MLAKFLNHILFCAFVFSVASSVSEFACCQGIYLRSVGPINESMGGAATAAPLDATGALYWNPAAISGLNSSEINFSLGLLLPSSELSSDIGAGAFGSGQPPQTLAGSTWSESGVSLLPDMAFVYKPESSRFSFGLGIFTIGGYSDNFPADLANPILSPQPPNGFGVGGISGDAELFQVIPTASCQVTDQLSLGFAPMINLAKVATDPLLLGPRNDANQDGYYSYGPGSGTRFAWGGGFQVGAYYVANQEWSLGATFKSPQWFEVLRFNSEDELGRPATVKIPFTLPLIVSLGAAYYGFEKYVIAVDLRYFDYANALGFRSAGFDSTGAATGLGWQSVFALSAGVQRRLNDWFVVRLGYSYNGNPINDSVTQFNIATSLIVQHVVSTGISYDLTKACTLSLSYSHGFENEITGPYVTPVGAVPGTSITSRASSDDLTTQVGVRF